jgi:hypothetical protein
LKQWARLSSVHAAPYIVRRVKLNQAERLLKTKITRCGLKTRSCSRSLRSLWGFKA